MRAAPSVVVLVALTALADDRDSRRLHDLQDLKELGALNADGTPNRERVPIRDGVQACLEPAGPPKAQHALPCTHFVLATSVSSNGTLVRPTFKPAQDVPADLAKCLKPTFASLKAPEPANSPGTVTLTFDCN